MYLYILIHVIYTCILVPLSIHVCTQRIHLYRSTYTSTHVYINMDKHIYETMAYSVYCSKFQSNKIQTYRLKCCFPLHLFNKVLLVVFIRTF